MTDVLLHLATTAEWRTHLGRGEVRPSVAEFVHLSGPDQVALPAQRLFAGRADVNLLVLDPARIGVEVRYEPGLPTDPASMLFPHAYGPVPTSAVLAVLPYRPEFAAPVLPALDTAGRALAVLTSVLRRTATAEEPVTGGVAVRTSSVPRSNQHNQVLVDGTADAAAVADDAARVLHDRPRPAALLAGDHLEGTASALAAAGHAVDALTVMAAPAGGHRSPGVRTVEPGALRPFRDAAWRRGVPDVDEESLAQLSDRWLREAEVVDLRCLAVEHDGAVVAAAVLKVDGATAVLDAVETDPAHRRRGHGDALVAEALAQAGDAGCDLVVLEADAVGRPRHWYARRGFRVVARAWQATLSQ
ncbi:GNAT family N-acetyltransferase [Pseudonocardia oceani]|uniref:GNAT family N-acetyltransferase n=1 Tax=Pseudonocardia oceani TaxID=2792013 RepID=UPI001CF62324|nr:GNAT family N-acetyltransferase [Pseudonocardia oceani]